MYPTLQNSNVVCFRAANEADVPEILALVLELAEYEKLVHEVAATEDDFRRTLFGARAYAEVLLAEVEGVVAGFALFFHNYSTFLGKAGLYIEDIFVRPAYRGIGIGRQLYGELSRIAKQRDCGRIEWWVLDWNQGAIEFYKRMGAEPMSEWTVFRLRRDQFEQWQ